MYSQIVSFLWNFKSRYCSFYRYQFKLKGRPWGNISSGVRLEHSALTTVLKMADSGSLPNPKSCLSQSPYPRDLSHSPMPCPTMSQRELPFCPWTFPVLVSLYALPSPPHPRPSLPLYHILAFAQTNPVLSCPVYYLHTELWKVMPRKSLEVLCGWIYKATDLSSSCQVSWHKVSGCQVKHSPRINCHFHIKKAPLIWSIS